MHDLARFAEFALHAHPHPALRLDELRALLVERAGRGLTRERLRTALEDEPTRFRVLELLRPVPTHDRSERHPPGEREDSVVWVVAIEVPRTPPEPPTPALRLRESVRWLARDLDTRSRLDVARWHSIAHADRIVREVSGGLSVPPEAA